MQKRRTRYHGWIAGLCGLLLAAGPLAAATYYVSPSGNDANTPAQATSISTPWKTLQHAASNMAAGDTCLIRAGTYPETVTVPNSGTAAAPITFQAYNNEAAIVSGATPIAGWTMETSNIYYAPMAWSLTESGIAGAGNQVFLGSAMQPEARFPNANMGIYPWQDSSTKPAADWNNMQSVGYSGTTNGWFTDSHLPVKADNYWVGATVHAMSGYGWIMQFPTVTSSAYSGTTIHTTDGNGGVGAYQFTGGADPTLRNEYYLSGIKGEMDSPGEWWYDAANQRLYIYSAATPANVQAKQRLYGFDLSGRSYIQLVKLQLFACSILTSATSSHETYNGIVMRYIHHSNVNASSWGLSLRTGDVLRNSDLGYDSRGLITLAGDDIRIINNNLHDSGYMPSFTCMIDVNGGTGVNRALISHNTLKGAGRPAVGYTGLASIVEYNDVSDAMKLTTDGGIIDNNLNGGNGIIRYNIFHDSPGPAGHLGGPVEGLYLDSQSSNWIIHHNIFGQVPGYAMQINARFNYNMVFNNTCVIGPTEQAALASSFFEDGPSGAHFYNNLFGKAISGGSATWALADLRYNLYGDPGYDPVSPYQLQAGSTEAIDQGTVIPGITDGYLGAAPDLGALEYGGTDWTPNVGYKAAPPSPDPTYSLPAMTFANQVRDGSFESGSLSPNWTVTGSAAIVKSPHTSWNDTRIRSGVYAVQCDAGTSEVKQTVTGLLPNHRYAFYVGAQGTDPALPCPEVITCGVRNYGFPAMQVTAPVAFDGSGIPQWHVNRVTFITGPSSTSADVFADVVNPNGGTYKVYIDDFAVILTQDYDDPQPQFAPLLQYTFDEGSGTTVPDHSGHGTAATFSGIAAWDASGVYGKAALFNGTNAYVATPNIATPGSVTVSCWAKSVPANWNAGYCLVSKRPSYLLHPTGGAKRMNFIIYVGGIAQWMAYDLADIQGWHHYVGTYDQVTGMQAIYVDGVVRSSWANPTFAGHPLDGGSTPLYAGRDGSNYLNASVDDLRVYDYAITDGEVAALYAADTSKRLHYHLDEEPGATQAWDSSVSGFNGVLTGGNPATDWVAGKDNGALHLNGTSSYLLASSFPAPGSVTVSCWAKSGPATWNAGYCLVARPPSFLLHPTLGATRMNFVIYVGGLQQWIAYDMPEIQGWHHYAGTYDQTTGTQALYVDGVLKQSLTSPSFVGHPLDPGSGDPLFVGHNGTNYLNGTVDDVRVYSRALSAYEVMDLTFQRTLPPYTGY